MRRAGGVLYISYTGMLEPLGQSQVLAYLERLAAERPIHLISFESEEERGGDARAALTRRMEKAGIRWHPLRYHQRPTASATAWDIAQGIALGARLMRWHGLSIVHARSYVPSVMALAIKRLTGARYIFDMRGFWADERVDAGLWPKEGQLYRLAKSFEKRFLLAADSVVSLTHAGKREIEGFGYLQGRIPPVTVIPTCADLARFRPGPQKAIRDFTLGFLGSAGTWNWFDEVLSFFNAVRARRAGARLLVVNRGEHDFIRACVERAGADGSAVEIVSASHSDVPALVQQMTAGIAMRRPAYSNLGCAPTKLAEYLGCGIPCVGNDRVGDVGKILRDRRVGVAMSGYKQDDHQAATEQLLSLLKEPGLKMRCRTTAEELFSLEAGVAGYLSIYDSLDAPRERVVAN